MSSSERPNVAMVLTPPAPAAIAVVRLRGPGVADFLKKHFSKTAKSNQCVHGELRNGERVLDDPVVVLGENSDWADLSLHGGTWVVQSVLELAKLNGFTVAPGDCSDDANSRLESDMLNSLPLARTYLSLRALLEQPKLWQLNLNPDEMLKDESLWWLLNPPQIAIVGEPNVGKSTLANALFGRERSITADLPGTTRDWVGDMADVDGLAVTLVDTPGQRLTDDAIERAAIGASGEKIRQSDLILEILDATQPPKNRIANSVTILNKIDRPAAWNIHSIPAIRLSAKTGQGLDKLRAAIRQRFGIGPDYPSKARWWTQSQRAILATGDLEKIRHEFGLSFHKSDLRVK
jgi:small GTP-binding protein